MEARKRLSRFITKNSYGNALHLGTYAAIPVRVHWTFGLLLLFATYTAVTTGKGTLQIVGFLTFIFVLFFCVVLHEYGHALAARHFGIKTRDIIISPIGGLARLERLPEKPIQEFYIALAGPLVNVVIGGVLAIFLLLFTGYVKPEVDAFNFDDPVEFIRYIAWINFALFLFNLVPAFPMDGGRVLRSLLAVKLGKLKATHIASTIGRILAVGFVIFGILNQHLILSVIGIFIFMMAGMEFKQVRLMTILKKTKASDLVRSEFTVIHPEDGFHKVIENYTAKQRNFLVFNTGGQIIGALPELFIRDIIKSKKEETKVGSHMTNATSTVSEDISLDELITIMKDKGIAIVSVSDQNNHLKGVIDRNRIEDFMNSKEF
ncbi:MAG: site-2 protease family protein [Saprospiraceae bacterium]|nr:site-2 protease family protein [Saprospiraceae bacterium]